MERPQDPTVRVAQQRISPGSGKSDQERGEKEPRRRRTRLRGHDSDLRSLPQVRPRDSHDPTGRKGTSATTGGIADDAFNIPTRREDSMSRRGRRALAVESPGGQAFASPLRNRAGLAPVFPRAPGASDRDY